MRRWCLEIVEIGGRLTYFSLSLGALLLIIFYLLLTIVFISLRSVEMTCSR